MSYLYHWINPNSLFRVGMYHLENGKTIYIEKLGRDLNEREAWMVLEGTVRDPIEKRMAGEALKDHYAVFNN